MVDKIVILAPKIVIWVIHATREVKNGDFEVPRVDFGGSWEAVGVPNGSPNLYFLRNIKPHIMFPIKVF